MGFRRPLLLCVIPRPVYDVQTDFQLLPSLLDRSSLFVESTARVTTTKITGGATVARSAEENRHSK